MEPEDIKRMNRDAIESSSVLYVVESGDDNDYLDHLRGSSTMISVLAFVLVTLVSYVAGGLIRPSFILVEKNGEMVVDRRKLAVLSLAVAVLAVVVLRYVL